jgi:3-oxoacyl-[acyl-carrier-protein] synthase II
MEGKTGVKPITRFDPSGFACKLGGEVEGFSIKDAVPKHYRKATKVMARDIELAVAAAKEAAESAGLVTRGNLPEDASEDTPGATTYPNSAFGCQIGAGLIAAESNELAQAMVTAQSGDQRGVDLAAWGERGMENLTPLWMLKYLPNMLACHVTIIHGCEGPSNTITCGEASGLLSVGESARVVERGDAAVCFSGSAESKVNFMGILRMQYAGRVGETGGALSGLESVLPFAEESRGGAIGEGAGIIVVEDLDKCKARGARVRALISGFGAGHSARRPFAGDGTPDDGLIAAIENALDDAGLKPGDIDAVLLYGLGMPKIDLAEAGAVIEVFGRDLASKVPVACLGPALGHCAAGNGGLLAATAVMMIEQQKVPSRAFGGASVLAGARGSAIEGKGLRHVLAASTSLGGQNAAVIFSRAN